MENLAQLIPFVAGGLMSSQLLEILKKIMPWLDNKQVRIFASVIMPIALGGAVSYLSDGDTGQAFTSALITYMASHGGYTLKNLYKVKAPESAELVELETTTSMLLPIPADSSIDEAQQSLDESSADFLMVLHSLSEHMDKNKLSFRDMYLMLYCYFSQGMDNHSPKRKLPNALK